LKVLLLVFLTCISLVSCSLTGRNLQPVAAAKEQRLLALLSGQSRHFSSLQTLADVELKRGFQKGTFTQVILAESPDKFRAEVLTNFGSPAMIITSDGDTARIYVVEQQRFFEGRATAFNLSRYLYFKVDPELLVRFLLYDVPVAPYSTWRVGEGKDHHCEVVFTGSNGLRQVYRFDPLEHLVSASRYQYGDELWTVQFSGFTGRPLRFPQEIILSLPGEDTRVTVKYDQPVVNETLSEKLFFQELPLHLTAEPIL